MPKIIKAIKLKKSEVFIISIVTMICLMFIFWCVSIYVEMNSTSFSYSNEVGNQKDANIINNINSNDSSSNSIANKIPVLLYHHISTDGKYGESVIELSKFEKQMKWLSQNGYSTIKTSDLFGYLTSDQKIRDKTFVISFDDGYKSVYQYAVPVLTKYGFTGVAFIITSKISQNFNEDEIAKMDWRKIFAADDILELGIHTNDMHKLNNNKNSIMLEQNEKDIYDDIAKAQLLLKSTIFSYPYGQSNEKIINALKKNNIKMAFTTENTYIKKGDNPLLLGRISIDGEIGDDEFKSIFNK